MQVPGEDLGLTKEEYDKLPNKSIRCSKAAQFQLDGKFYCLMCKGKKDMDINAKDTASNEFLMYLNNLGFNKTIACGRKKYKTAKLRDKMKEIEEDPGDLGKFDIKGKDPGAITDRKLKVTAYAQNRLMDPIFVNFIQALVFIKTNKETSYNEENEIWTEEDASIGPNEENN